MNFIEYSIKQWLKEREEDDWGPKRCGKQHRGDDGKNSFMLTKITRMIQSPFGSFPLCYFFFLSFVSGATILWFFLWIFPPRNETNTFTGKNGWHHHWRHTKKKIIVRIKKFYGWNQNRLELEWKEETYKNRNCGWGVCLKWKSDEKLRTMTCAEFIWNCHKVKFIHYSVILVNYSLNLKFRIKIAWFDNLKKN